MGMRKLSIHDPKSGLVSMNQSVNFATAPVSRHKSVPRSTYQIKDIGAVSVMRSTVETNQ